MKSRILLLSLATIGLMAVSCQQQTETETSIEKKAAREVILSSKIVGDSTEHTVEQKIWSKGTIIAAKVTTFKTINLPKTKDTVEDSNGNPKTIEYDTKYPIFVTVQ